MNCHPSQPGLETSHRSRLPTPESDVSEANLSELVRDFMKSLQFKPHTSLHSTSRLTEAMVSKLKTLGLSDVDYQRIQYLESISCQYPLTCHKGLSFEAKLYIACFTILGLAIDDILEGSDLCQTFAQNFRLHDDMGHPLLNCYARLLVEETTKIFDPYAVSNIISSAIDSVCAMHVESAYLRGIARPGTPFSLWFRLKSGYSMAYCFFAFPRDDFPESRWLKCYLPFLPNWATVMELINDWNGNLTNLLL
ncbi:hypothetical protein NLG97_g2435 [Lecanicillium saksenae]|uniref:Uncharacterized protein n=1 Tax=Lecanicillium saksenae TaxID=468837 RepID=A0ACC1R3K9_9HYPO|nr:hypothetical protein NLG97_g2435 [Lecanicillium saksenae]